MPPSFNSRLHFHECPRKLNSCLEPSHQCVYVLSDNLLHVQVRSRLLPDVVADHAGFFKVAGDMNAYLYTSSRAMHSDILNLLSDQVRLSLNIWYRV